MTDNPFAEVVRAMVTVTAPRRRGPARTKLHTFAFMAWGEWYPQIVATQKQIVAVRRQNEERQLMMESGRNPGPLGWIAGTPRRAEYPAGALGSEPGAIVHLADGVDVRADALVVILDALRDSNRREVAVEDIKVVLSQLGSDIKATCAMPRPQRRHAYSALCEQIAQRCSTLT